MSNLHISKLSPADRAAVLSALGIMRRGSKYHNKPTQRIMPNGSIHTFPSKREAERYDVLAAMQRAGKIRGLQLQRSYVLSPSYITSDGERVRALTYVADFVYVGSDGHTIVEDAKGKRTQEFITKKKLMHSVLGISVKEV